MGAPHLPGIRIGLLLVLVACNTASAAKYGDPCSRDTDCEEKKAPYCQVFFEDRSYGHNKMDPTEEFATALRKLDTVNKRQGVCVECTVDCHCGVNEYCGYDYKDTYDKDTKEWSFEYQVTIPPGITSANEGNGMTANAKRFLELHAKQFEGVPLISKCKKYSTSHMKEKPKVCTPEDKLDLDDFGKMVEQSLLSAGSDDELMRTCNFEDSSRTKRTKVRRTPRYWPKDAQDRFCGRIVSWGPKFHEVQVLGENLGSVMITNSEFQMSGYMSTDEYDSPARCVPGVVAKDPITCPSCLHPTYRSFDYSPYFEVDEIDCLSPRKDETVCCVSKGWWGQVLGESGEAPRSCHDSSINSVELRSEDYNRYNTCESACARRDRYYPPYYDGCKDPATGEATTLMTAAPTNEDEANQKTWCECVQECLQCTGRNGGIGARPVAVANLNAAYENIHGSCAPPPDGAWETPAPEAVSTATPAPTTSFAATDFVCTAQTPEEECNVKERPTPTTCMPSCVDCLVKAMQHGCDGRTTVDGKCPMETKHMYVPPMCERRELYARTNFYRFDVASPAIEWEGFCQEGVCKACHEHDGELPRMRCTRGYEGGRAQVCVNGEWTLTPLTKEFSMATRVEKVLIAITVIIGCCSFALLGVLAAVCMLKQQPAAKSSWPGAAGAEEAPNAEGSVQAGMGSQTQTDSRPDAPVVIESTGPVASIPGDPTVVSLQQVRVDENTGKCVKFNRGPQGNVGIACEKLGSLGARIIRLIPDGPAMNCGQLAVGDIIESVDGMPLASLSLDEIGDGLKGQPGSIIALYIHARGAHAETDSQTDTDTLTGAHTSV